MIPSKGKRQKIKRNYHITWDEFKILSGWVRNHASPKYYMLVMTQFGMGLRAGMAVAIHILDFQDDYRKLTWRDNKTDQVYTDPVPEFLRQLFKDYVAMNGHTLTNGWMFPNHLNPKKGYISEKAYESWFSQARKYIGRSHKSFLDIYEVPGERKCILKGGAVVHKKWHKYRIGTHSLRRLHRTVLVEEAEKLGVSLYNVKEMCHYSDWQSFETYINKWKLMRHHGTIVNSVFNPALAAAVSSNQTQRSLTLYDQASDGGMI